MRFVAIVLLVMLTGCNFSKLYPSLLAGGGAGIGSIAGPGGAVLGGVSGAALGGVLTDDPPIDPALIAALTEGDVQKLLELKLEDHTSGFEEFTATIKKILTAAACFLGLYLLVPIFVARRCSKNEAEKNQTRIPFPTKTRTPGRNEES